MFLHWTVNNTSSFLLHVFTFPSFLILGSEKEVLLLAVHTHHRLCHWLILFVIMNSFLGGPVFLYLYAELWGIHLRLLPEYLRCPSLLLFLMSQSLSSGFVIQPLNQGWFFQVLVFECESQFWLLIFSRMKSTSPVCMWMLKKRLLGCKTDFIKYTYPYATIYLFISAIWYPHPALTASKVSYIL